MMLSMTPAHDALEVSRALQRLDAAAVRRIRVMLRSMGWRDVARWLRGLEREADRCTDVEALDTLIVRVEGGER